MSISININVLLRSTEKFTKFWGTDFGMKILQFSEGWCDFEVDGLSIWEAKSSHFFPPSLQTKNVVASLSELPGYYRIVGKIYTVVD